MDVHRAVCAGGLLCFSLIGKAAGGEVGARYILCRAWHNLAGGIAVRDDDTLLHYQLRDLWQNMERLRLTEYMRYVNDWRRVLWVNFLSGIARGFGFAVGFTLLSAMALVALERFSLRSIPGLEAFFDEVLLLLKNNLK